MRPCLIILLGIVPAAAVSAHAAEYTLADIGRAWKAREEGTKTGNFEWIEHRVFSKGSIFDPTMDEFLNPNKATIPPEEHVYDAPCTMVFDRTRIRYSYQKQQWLSETKSYAPWQEVYCFDGKVNRDWASPHGSYKYATGGFSSGDRFGEASNYHTWAVLLTYRPSWSTLQIEDPDQFGISANRGRIADHSCIIVEPRVQTTTKLQGYSFWVDPDRDFLVIRILEHSSVQPTVKVDIEYEKKGTQGWEPTNWNIVETNRDGLVSHSFASTLQHSQINGKISEKELEFPFPPGTLVGGGSEEPEPRHYIQLEAGKIRPIPPEDLGASYDQLLATQPGQAFKGSSTSRATKVTMFAIVTFVIALASLMVWRRHGVSRA